MRIFAFVSGLDTDTHFTILVICIRDVERLTVVISQASFYLAQDDKSMW